jgi:hypothetical protein
MASICITSSHFLSPLKNKKLFLKLPLFLSFKNFIGIRKKGGSNNYLRFVVVVVVCSSVILSSVCVCVSSHRKNSSAVSNYSNTFSLLIYLFFLPGRRSRISALGSRPPGQKWASSSSTSSTRKSLSVTVFATPFHEVMKFRKEEKEKNNVEIESILDFILFFKIV